MVRIYVQIKKQGAFILKNNAKEKKIIYYTDELNDDFAGVGERRKIEIDEHYPYIRKNIFYKAAKFIVYRVFVTPFAFLFCKAKFGMKIVGKEKYKPFKKDGSYLYGNHTQIPGDGFIPNVITFPQTTHIIVNPDNVALKGTQNIMMMLGALPTPTTLRGFASFEKALAEHISQNRAIVIYPEAHIWPYYTGIRPFPSTSFRYPAKDKKPVFAFTVTYRCSKRGRPRIVVYVDGPFQSDKESVREREKELREMVYCAMCERANTSENYAFTEYRKKEEDKQ